MQRFPPRSRAPLAAGLLLAWLAASGGARAESLHAIFEQAWARSPQGQTLVARGEEAQASRSVAESLFPGAPKVGIARRSDRWNDNLGKEESEIGLAVPLWLPGQQAARLAVAEAEQDEHRHRLAAGRLAVAGELRMALWTLLLAATEAEVAGERLAAARQLEADVARRVKAGDLAHADLLLARQEVAAAGAAAAEAELRAVRSRQRYRVVSGGEQLPDDPQEPPASAADALHPRLAAARAGVERARAGRELVRESRREAPSLALQYRRERDAAGALPRDSVGFALTIPLAAEVRNAPLTAGANTAVVEAEAQYRRLLDEVEAETRAAEAQLAAARIGAELAVDRERAAGERLALLRRAFELGESALVELLRAQAQATEARGELVRSRTRLSAALADLNQARGITP